MLIIDRDLEVHRILFESHSVYCNTVFMKPWVLTSFDGLRGFQIVSGVGFWGFRVGIRLGFGGFQMVSEVGFLGF